MGARRSLFAEHYIEKTVRVFATVARASTWSESVHQDGLVLWSREVLRHISTWGARAVQLMGRAGFLAKVTSSPRTLRRAEEHPLLGSRTSEKAIC